MTIQKNIVPESKYSLKCPNPMIPIGICVHNTANDASAKNEISYMVGNALQTSFHFAVDDLEVWQGLPIDRNGWHAGDGNGDGNRKHIGIEICYSKSGGDRFTRAEENAAEFIAQLLRERNWGVERVKKHQDFSGKYCPHRTLDLGWDRFLNIVKNKLGGSVPETIVVNKADWEKVRSNSETLDLVTDKLGLPRNSRADVVNSKIDQLAQSKFDEGFEKGKAQSGSVDMSKWKENGLVVEVTNGNVKTITNYEKKL